MQKPQANKAQQTANSRTNEWEQKRVYVRERDRECKQQNVGTKNIKTNWVIGSYGKVLWTAQTSDCLTNARSGVLYGARVLGPQRSCCRCQSRCHAKYCGIFKQQKQQRATSNVNRKFQNILVRRARQKQKANETRIRQMNWQRTKGVPACPQGATSLRWAALKCKCQQMPITSRYLVQHFSGFYVLKLAWVQVGLGWYWGCVWVRLKLLTARSKIMGKCKVLNKTCFHKTCLDLQY